MFNPISLKQLCLRDLIHDDLYVYAIEPSDDNNTMARVGISDRSQMDYVLHDAIFDSTMDALSHRLESAFHDVDDPFFGSSSVCNFVEPFNHPDFPSSSGFFADHHNFVITEPLFDELSERSDNNVLVNEKLSDENVSLVDQTFQADITSNPIASVQCNKILKRRQPVAVIDRTPEAKLNISLPPMTVGLDSSGFIDRFTLSQILYTRIGESNFYLPSMKEHLVDHNVEIDRRLTVSVAPVVVSSFQNGLTYFLIDGIKYIKAGSFNFLTPSFNQFAPKQVLNISTLLLLQKLLENVFNPPTHSFFNVIRRFKCLECTCDFTDADNLRRHYRNIHVDSMYPSIKMVLFNIMVILNDYFANVLESHTRTCIDPPI